MSKEFDCAKKAVLRGELDFAVYCLRHLETTKRLGLTDYLYMLSQNPPIHWNDFKEEFRQIEEEEEEVEA